MTNPRLSPPDAARRRFMLVQTAILIAFAGAMVATRLLIPQLEDPAQRWLLAAIPAVLLGWWAWEFFRMVRADDEMMQAYHLRIAAISGMLVLLGGTIWGMFERLVDAPALPAYLLLPAYALVSGFVSLALARRG